jgi:hypothetical protein
MRVGWSHRILPSFCVMLEPDLRWEKPPLGVVKINTDVALMENAFALVLVAENDLEVKKHNTKMHQPKVEL